MKEVYLRVTCIFMFMVENNGTSTTILKKQLLVIKIFFYKDKILQLSNLLHVFKIFFYICCNHNHICYAKYESRLDQEKL